jgi:F0F1-type ATP synthase membrane subunit c/vacuolar-type H+-ATPase subunit K
MDDRGQVLVIVVVALVVTTAMFGMVLQLVYA